jgi:hypothetical protein
MEEITSIQNTVGEFLENMQEQFLMNSGNSKETNKHIKNVNSPHKDVSNYSSIKNANNKKTLPEEQCQSKKTTN